MASLRRKGLFESSRVLNLPVAAVRPNPAQPRRNFSAEELDELAGSIRDYGILQPLSVRRAAGGYELVSGERRLRAARLAGLSEVPCIVVDVDERESALLALVENLQRKDLDFLEEARALSTLISTYKLSQEEAARKIGKSQSAVANKLRLLKLSPETLELLRKNGMTERHARALLCLEEESLQQRAAKHVVKNRLTVAKTEAYVTALLSPLTEKKLAARRPTFVIKDVRFFLNTISKGLSIMQGAGVDVQYGRQETNDAILLTIKIPK